MNECHVISIFPDDCVGMRGELSVCRLTLFLLAFFLKINSDTVEIYKVEKLKEVSLLFRIIFIHE